MSTDQSAFKHNCITVTAHLLAYSARAHETVPIGHCATLAFEYFSCVPSFLCLLLPSCSGCTFCHPAVQVIDPETPLCSRSIRKNKNKTEHPKHPTSCFNLNCPSWPLPFISSCVGIPQGSKEETWHFCPNLVEKPQALPFLSVASAWLAFPLLLYCSIKGVWKEARNAKES